MRVLVIEDNERLSGLIIAGLNPRGFVCDSAYCLADADTALDCASYDAVILDLGFSDGDGMTWFKNQRRARQLVPTLILTARGSLEDRVEGLDSGADDYVVKPIDVDELAARLRALLRRPGPRGLKQLEAGELRFDTANRAATMAGRAIELSRKEGDLLELLMRRLGMVVQRHAIEETLYSFNEPVTPNAVEATISRLRRKLDGTLSGVELVTIRGVGYMLQEVSR
jgi:two-component system, OmpR family, response regulator QseB